MATLAEQIASLEAVRDSILNGTLARSVSEGDKSLSYQLPTLEQVNAQLDGLKLQQSEGSTTPVRRRARSVVF